MTLLIIVFLWSLCSFLCLLFFARNFHFQRNKTFTCLLESITSRCIVLFHIDRSYVKKNYFNVLAITSIVVHSLSGKGGERVSADRQDAACSFSRSLSRHADRLCLHLALHQLPYWYDTTRAHLTGIDSLSLLPSAKCWLAEKLIGFAFHSVLGLSENLMTEACMCKQLAQRCYVAEERPKIEPGTSRSRGKK